MPLSFREAKQPELVVGQDGILRAGCQPAPAGLFTRGSGGLPTRRRLPTCPTTSAEFPLVGKLSGIGRKRLPHVQSIVSGTSPIFFSPAALRSAYLRIQASQLRPSAMSR